MPYCSVRFCGINNMTEDFRKDNITFHRFPNDPAVKLKWVLAIRLKKERWYPSYASVVCSLHFKNECFQWRNKRKFILSTAVPTERLFTPYVQTLQHLHTKFKTQSSKPGRKCKRQKKPEGTLMICKVYRYLEAEYKTLRYHYGEDCDLTPLSDILWRTAEATGVSKKTVTNILINESFIIEENEASFKPMLDRDSQDPERLNEPTNEFARLPPAPVPLPEVPIPKLPTPKAPTAIMPADVRKLNIAKKPSPVNNAHGVANTAENLLVQHDNPNEHKLKHVYPSEVRPEMILIKEEVVDDAWDEQYYVMPMKLPEELTSEMHVIKKENTDAELDDINNNDRDFSDKTGEIKMNPANNEIEHMKDSLDNITWHPTELPVKYEPRDEFINYYKNFI